MATEHTAPALTLVQPRRALTGAERQARYKAKLKAKAARPAVIPAPEPVTLTPVPAPIIEAQKEHTRSFPLSAVALRAAAAGLALVGLSMSATYARSLGSSDLSGWLFLALGLCADCAALALPSVAASAWRAGERTTAGAAWLTWTAVYAFALLGSVGFASVSISDVTMARAAQVTPQVTQAQGALSDAMAARDRGCKGGVGKFCREREAAVVDRQQALDDAMGAVAQMTDPQTEAAIYLVVWVSRGAIKPAAGDFAMVRLAPWTIPSSTSSRASLAARAGRMISAS
jgi:hypothetical protein